MKKLLFIVLLLSVSYFLEAQANKIDQLQALEQNQISDQKITATASLKSSSRLFADKNDLTTVILIIPADSVVAVLDSDSTYLHVIFQDNEGYIFKRHAILNNLPVNNAQSVRSQQALQENPPVQEETQSRFSYLENKYGSNMAARLMSGKIWKGMNSEMVKDSWGSAQKINRVISGNTIKEEWIFKYTWLYFENNALVEWGPIRR